MLENRRTGTDYSGHGSRSRIDGHSVQLTRRSIQPQIRRSIDGVSKMPASNQPKLAIHEQSPQKITRKTSRSVSRDASNVKPALPRQSRSVVLTRPTAPTKSKGRKAKPRKRLHLPFIRTTIVTVILLVSVSVSHVAWHKMQDTEHAADVLSSSIDAEGDSDSLTEADITDEQISEYQVPSDLPRLIRIPRLNVEARIKRLGLQPDGGLASPANIFDTGWYQGSSKPGAAGAVLIDGYVHGPTKPGIFYRANNLKAGDTVEIERGDGKLFIYSVVSTEGVDQDQVDVSKLLTSVDPGKPGLNLITSTQRYDIKAQKYEQRLIVYLVQQ